MNVLLNLENDESMLMLAGGRPMFNHQWNEFEGNLARKVIARSNHSALAK